MISNEGTVEIEAETDLIEVRKIAREVSTALGFGITDITRIITAASELARNIYLYAKRGRMKWSILYELNRKGLQLLFEDNGPGIPNLEMVLRGGYSSGKGLGLGISGSKRLMDSLEINTKTGYGTTIIIKKWLRG